MSLLAAIGSYSFQVPQVSFSTDWVASSFATVDANTGTATITQALKSVATEIPLPTGNWYWEVTVDSTVASSGFPVIGVSTTTDGYPGRAGSGPGVGVFMLGTQNFLYVNGTEFSAPNTAAIWTLGVAYSSASRTVTFYRDGITLGSGIVSGIESVYIVAGSGGTSGSLPKFFAVDASPASVPAGFNSLSQAPVLGNQWIVAPAGTISHAIETATKNTSLFVASTEPSAGASTTYLSNDGLSWTTTAGKTGGFRGLYWNSTYAKFFAGEGSGGRISTTTDGITWAVTVVGTARWNGFDSNGTIMVAVGQSGVISTSTNGTSWTSRNSGGTNALNAVTWDAPRSRFFIAGSFVFLHSPDGINWSSGGTVNGIRRSIATNSNIMVQVGDAGQIYTSTTGTTSGSWTLRTSGTTANLMSVVWTGERFVAVGFGGTILNSTDGITWSSVSSGTSNNLYSIVKSESRLFVLGSNTLLYTP